MGAPAAGDVPSREQTAFRWLVAVGLTGWIVCIARLAPGWAGPIGAVVVVVVAAGSAAWATGRVSAVTLLDVVTGAVTLVGLACSAELEALNPGLTLSGTTGIGCLLAWAVLLVRRRGQGRRAARWKGVVLVPVLAVAGLALLPTAFNLRVRAAGDGLDVFASSVLLHIGPDGEPTEQSFEPPVVVGTFTIESVYFVASRESRDGREVRLVLAEEGWADLVYVESTPSVPGHWGRAPRNW